MRPPSPSIPEKEFLVDALKQSLRLDGRALLEQRKPRITFGPELGWVECALDKTRHVFASFLLSFFLKIYISNKHRVVAQVDAKMVKPPPERPFEGLITIHSEISPMAGTEYESGR
jgi:exosome complex component RRP45